MKLRGGCGHQYLPQDKIFGDLHRCLITSQFLTPPDDRFGQVTLSPTWQNFPPKLQGEPFGNFDNYLKALKDRGVYVLANLLNGFNKKYTLPLKALPKNAPGLSSNDLNSWTLYRKLLEQFVLRYGHVKNDALIDIADFSIRYSDGRLVAPQTKVSGLNYTGAMHILNELQNTWVKPPEEGRLSGSQYADLLYYLVDAIWAIDPDMAIVAQCTAGWDVNFWNEFFTTWNSNYRAFPNYDPTTNTGIAISFNQYLVGGCGAFGQCIAKDPYVEIPRIGKEVNDFLVAHGAYAMVTEHGNGSERNSDLGYRDYPGLDKYQSQAKHIIDSTNLWLSFSNIIGCTFYQYVEDPQEPRFKYTGLLLHDATNTPKPSYAIVKDAFSKPLPEPPQPTTVNLTVINKQLQWSDGQPCDLVHADSPEPRLHPNYKAAFSAECKALPTFGINAITVTMRGDDVTAISPWLNNTPSQGVDVAKLQTWHTQLTEFLTECEKNNLRGVVIAYLGERTNFKSITDQQYENWFIEMGKIFQDISGQIIFGWEEIWDGSDSNTMRFCDRIGSLLKSYLPNSLLMYHNNPGQKAFNAGSSFVKLVCIQETSIAAMKATAQAALAKGFAVHFHEPYGLVKLSNTQDANKKIVTDLCAAAKEVGMKNVGIFANDYDLQAPDPNKLSYLYKHLSQTLSGTIPNPNPMARKLFITTGTVANYDLATELTEGENLPEGSYAMYVDGEVPVTISVDKDEVNFIPARSEGQKPLSFGGDDSGKLRLKVFPKGNYVAKVSGQPDLKFTVGTATPPPPADIKGVSFALKPDGKIEFTFEGGAKKLVTPI